METNIEKLDLVSFEPIEVETAASEVAAVPEMEPIIDMNTNDSFAAYLEKYVVDLRAFHTDLAANEEFPEEMRKKSRDALLCLDMVDDNTYVLENSNIYRSMHTIAFVKGLIPKFRSIMRRNRIPRLDCIELLREIKKCQNKHLRAMLLVMLGTVIMFMTNNPTIVKERSVYVRVQFMVMRYAATLGYTPVLASKLFESYTDMFHELKRK